MSDITQKTEWKVGEVVAYYGPYSRCAEKTVTIEKIYKTGHLVVNGRRFKAWSDTAHETGKSWSKSHIAKLTPDRIAQVAKTQKKRRMMKVSDWLVKADPDRVPDEHLDALYRLTKTEPTP